jgi:lipopolysaccharide transport system ATP-binding protein
MSDIAVRVEHLSKQYMLGGQRAAYQTFREALIETAAAPLRWLKGGVREQHTFWALNDVSLEIKQGEAVGIIGRNGAGKSTLLKILSSITTPTRGRVELYGRVGSLLEVGTGFHPELTGRENIFLNGAILGMSRSEILRKFDEIVAFSEVEKFLDTPVKHYSSGMYIRLAFAVAAHLEPEILVVDEVLAVGDADFQKKCLGKMSDVAHEGRTVLFVSHNMAAVTRLCERVILLFKGTVEADGISSDVVTRYLTSSTGSMAVREWHDIKDAPGSNVAKLRAVRVCNENGIPSSSLDIRKPVRIEMEFDVLEGGHKLTPNFHLYNGEGICVFVTTDQDPTWKGTPRGPGRYKSTVWIPGNFLAEGTMTLWAALSVMNPVTVHFAISDAAVFQIVDSLDGDSMRGEYAGSMPGIVRPALKWETEFSNSETSK